MTENAVIRNLLYEIYGRVAELTEGSRKENAPRMVTPVVSRPLEPEIVAGLKEELEKTVFEIRSGLADFEQDYQELVKKIPQQIEKVTPRVHSKALGIFRKYFWLTIINLVSVVGHLVVSFVN